MTIPLWAKIVALLVLVGSLMGMGYYIKGTIEENKQLKANQAAILDRLEKAEQANTRQDETFLRRDELQNDVRSGVADVTVRIKQESANDPVTRNVLSTRLPDGVRRAIVQAAAARAAAQCEGADCPDAD